jgi:hypothetical protein
MENRIAQASSDSVWRIYLLLHDDVDEHDDRRELLRRYITNLSDAGEHNPDALQTAGLLYLRKLDELGRQRTDRLARYRALEEQTGDPLAARLLGEVAFASKGCAD